ncbi:MAG: DUF423 domain-containing protein [Anaerolineaceae bacterium]|nr:DUF423 domain-containing protein [Anaerolineaceae bacterium]
MKRTFVIVAGVFGALGVSLGAFGAHGLSAMLDANGHAGSFQTATEYLMIHTLALLFTAIAAQQWPGKLTQWAGYLFIIGNLLFSGSLYVLSMLNMSVMGAVAPFGGAALIAGWVLLAVVAWRAKG